MLSLFSNPPKGSWNSGPTPIAEIEEDNVKNEMFFKQVEVWRNIQQKYIAKITETMNSLREKSLKLHKKELTKLTGEAEVKQCSKLQEHKPFCACLQLCKMLQLLVDSHKSFLSKINFDIFMVNLDASEKLLTLSKKLVEQEKVQQKQIIAKKQQIQKIIQKKDKLRKQKQEQQMVQIFISDSFEATLDQKIRKKGKIKQLQKQIQQYEIKVKEIIEQYRTLTEKQKMILIQIKNSNKELSRCKGETLLKMRVHLNSYWNSLLTELKQLNNFQESTCQCYHQYIFEQLENHEDQLIKRLTDNKQGFVQNSLKLINENVIDQLIDYNKDKDVKSRVKKMMETDEVNPNQTDETCRQVKLIKKILSQENIGSECMSIFRNIVNKSSKHRMNFVFVMQFYRLNNKFQMVPEQIYPLYCLISEFLQACYSSRDSFSMKHMMILLMTYYVNHTGINGQNTKLYLIHFFNKNPMWKDMEYWESILLQCIYVQKKTTINAMIVGSFGNLHKKKQLLEGQRAAILNQMLIVVRNMIIFDYTEKDVKAFAIKFIKLLKQDEKFQKDVFNTIEDAVKEEAKLHAEQKEQIKEFYKRNFDITKPESYNIPVNVRRSYIG